MKKKVLYRGKEVLIHPYKVEMTEFGAALKCLKDNYKYLTILCKDIEKWDGVEIKEVDIMRPLSYKIHDHNPNRLIVELDSNDDVVYIHVG
jgi:hypothetical protein